MLYVFNGTPMINLKVELGERSYPIFIGADILGKVGEALALYHLNHQVAVVTTTKVHRLYGQRLRSSLEPHVGKIAEVVLGDGERYKTLKTAEQIYTRLIQDGCERATTIVAFGGGVVGDIAGFVAATYLRGVNYVQIPTTLLAQVDSSVGGKVGVNHALGKNLIGAFHQPRLVWIDVALLKTLPKREVTCGLSEVIKYGIIWDADFFGWLERYFSRVQRLEPEVLQKVVQRSCQIKAEIVSLDEREKNLRMILNFGHTVGHALEAVTQYKRFRHGEAIAFGMRSEGRMALEKGSWSDGEFRRLEALLNRLDMKATTDGLCVDEVKRAMAVDKKVLNGKLRIVLPKKIGQVEVNDDVDDATVMAGLRYILKEATA